MRLDLLKIRIILLISLCVWPSCKKEDIEDEQKKSIVKYLEGRSLSYKVVDGVYYARLIPPLCDTIIGETDTVIPCTEVRKIERGEVVRFVFDASVFGGSMYATNDAYLADSLGLLKMDLVEIVVGRGEVIFGLDKGLEQMYYGEGALILFPFTKGYGDGYMNIVPPQSALMFRVKVLD
jgi:hypothetical protein